MSFEIARLLGRTDPNSQSCLRNLAAHFQIERIEFLRSVQTEHRFIEPAEYFQMSCIRGESSDRV